MTFITLKNNVSGNRIHIYPHHQLQVQHSMAGPNLSNEEDMTNSPNKRIRRSEEELSEAANLISRGLTFQAVSDKWVKTVYVNIFKYWYNLISV